MKERKKEKEEEENLARKSGFSTDNGAGVRQGFRTL